MKEKNHKKALKNVEKTQKMEQKAYKNTYIYGFIFIIFSIILEITNCVMLNLGIFPTSLGIELAIIIILAGIIFIVPTKPAKISICSVLIVFQILLNIVNASLYKTMQDIITVDMIFTLGYEAFNIFRIEQLDLLALGVNMAVLVVYILTLILGSIFMIKFKFRQGKLALCSLIMLLSTVEMLGFGLLNVSKVAYFADAESEYIMESGKYLYDSQSTKFASFKKYGFWSFYLNNVKNFVTYKKKISKKEYSSIRSSITSDEGALYNNSMYNGNLVSGLLDGDNLIVVMMESLEWFAIDEFNTPDLYNLIFNDSVYFTNFYGNNKTNISEQISILGSVPNDYSLTTISNRVGINLPNSLPKLFKNKGYESVNYFHDYSGKMYNRNTINKNIGFDKVYAMEDYTEDDKSEYFGDFIDDGNYVWAMRNEMMPSDKKFFSFFTTVTTHGGYNTSNERYQEYYEQFEKNYSGYRNYVRENNLSYILPEVGSEEYELLKEYKSRAIAVNHAIQVMTNYLKTNKDKNGRPLINNTSIVLFSDHNAYYNDLSYTMKDIDKYAESKDAFCIPFAIYNKKLTPGEVGNFCSAYDIYPTICDLYGLSYNKALTQGNSVFCEDIENSVFVSSMSGAFNEYFYTLTYDEYIQASPSIQNNTKLAKFKQNLDNFFKKQQMIEEYYRINFHSYK